MTVSIKDRGWNKIKNQVLSRVPKEVVVGITRGEAGKTYSDGLATVDVATWNHFGTKNIPARPFISGTVTEKQAEITNMIKRLQTGVVTLKVSEDEALKLLGEKVRGYILARINAGFPPPNADSTVAAKGSSKPLIDTGQLKGSITYEVRPESS